MPALSSDPLPEPEPKPRTLDVSCHYVTDPVTGEVQEIVDKTITLPTRSELRAHPFYRRCKELEQIPGPSAHDQLAEVSRLIEASEAELRTTPDFELAFYYQQSNYQGLQSLLSKWLKDDPEYFVPEVARLIGRHLETMSAHTFFGALSDAGAIGDPRVRDQVLSLSPEAFGEISMMVSAYQHRGLVLPPEQCIQKIFGATALADSDPEPGLMAMDTMGATMLLRSFAETEPAKLAAALIPFVRSDNPHQIILALDTLRELDAALWAENVADDLGKLLDHPLPALVAAALYTLNELGSRARPFARRVAVLTAHEKFPVASAALHTLSVIAEQSMVLVCLEGLWKKHGKFEPIPGDSPDTAEPEQFSPRLAIAREALGRMATFTADPAEHPELFVEPIVGAYGNLLGRAPEASEFIESALERRSIMVRTAALVALARCSDHAAMEPLLRVACGVDWCGTDWFKKIKPGLRDAAVKIFHEEQARYTAAGAADGPEANAARFFKAQIDAALALLQSTGSEPLDDGD